MSDRNYELYVEKKNARAEGHAEGKAEGKAEGREEGRVEGREEGNVEGVAKTISVFRDLGVSPEMIAEAKARLDALASK